MKARPISPGTRHPMRKLFGLAGRAWSFVTSGMKGEHFILKSTNEVPSFLNESFNELKHQGDVKVIVQDIEGCFPTMPKEAIRFAARDIANGNRTDGHHMGCGSPKDPNYRNVTGTKGEKSITAYGWILICLLIY